MKTTVRCLAVLLGLTVSRLCAEESSAYQPESSSLIEIFSTKVVRVLSFQDGNASYAAYVVDWKGHEVVAVPFTGFEPEAELKPGDTVRCQMQRMTQRLGDRTSGRITFSLVANRGGIGSAPPGDQLRRFEAVAAEVEARRQQREGIARAVAEGAPRAGPPASAAANDPLIAAVRAADAERVAATKAGDAVRLDAIYSDDLRYAHSSGHVDDKASYLKALTSRSTVYESYDYREQNFRPIAPGVVLMTGRVLIHARNAGGANELDLNFLAVWREEGGRWRFVAWQSCKNPPTASAAK